MSTIDRQDAIDLATTHIGADALEPRGLYIYFDDATRDYFIVESDDMEMLGRMLDEGSRDACSHWCHDDGTSDAYSHWCNQTTAIEVDLEAVADFAEGCDDLDALEQEAGTADDMPTFMALMFCRDAIVEIIEQNAEISAEIAA